MLVNKLCLKLRQKINKQIINKRLFLLIFSFELRYYVFEPELEFIYIIIFLSLVSKHYIFKKSDGKNPKLQS